MGEKLHILNSFILRYPYINNVFRCFDLSNDFKGYKYIYEGICCAYINSVTNYFIDPVLIQFRQFRLSALLVKFAFNLALLWIRNSSDSRSSLALKGEHSLTINVLVFIKFDFN